MSWATLGLAGFQIVSGLQQAEIMRGQAAIGRDVARLNAEEAEIDAFNAEKDGYTQEARYQRTIDQINADQEVVFAARNQDSGYGTAADIKSDSKVTGFLNALDIRNQAHAKAMGYKNEAANILLQGSLNESAQRLQANSVQNAAIINGASTALTGYNKLNLSSKETLGGTGGNITAPRSTANVRLPSN